MRRFSWLLLLVLAAAPASASAQAPLGWKLKDRFYVEVTTSQQQSMKLQGKAADRSTDITLLFAVQPQAKATDGSRTIDLTVETIKVTSPAKGPAPDELIFKALEKAELKVTLGPDLRVRQVDGLAEVVKNFGGVKGVALPPAVRDTMQSSFEGLISFLMSEVLVPLPEKAVQKGSQWEQQSTLRLPMTGTMSLQKELTYEGKGRLPHQNLERVTVKGKLTYAPAKEGGDLLGVKVLKAEVKASDYKGTLHFDSAAGRLAHGEVKLKTDIAVTMLVNKQKVQSGGVREETLTIRTFDKKPAPQ